MGMGMGTQCRALQGTEHVVQPFTVEEVKFGFQLAIGEQKGMEEMLLAHQLGGFPTTNKS